MPWRIRRTRWLLAGTALVGLLALLALDGAMRVRDAATDLRVARTEIRAASESLRGLIALDTDAWPTPDDFVRAREGLREGDERLASASDRLGYLKTVASALGWLPRWGHAVGRAPDVLALGQETVAAARTLVDLSEPVFEAGEAEDSAALVAEVRTMLVERREELDAALVRLEAVRDEAGVLSDGEWPWPFASAGALLTLLQEELAPVSRARETVTEVSRGFDALLGFGEPRRYVVMGQNDHEIRATGGFLGTLGSLTIAEGAARDQQFGAVQSYEQQEPPFPRPVAEFNLYHGGTIWRLRDFNWEPDFPRSAEAVLTEVERQTGLTADGAIAVDTRAIELLVGVFEPLEVAIFDVPVTSENWRRMVEASLLENLARDRAARVEGKETFMDPIMEALIARMQTLDRDEFAPFLAALRRSVEGRHLQVYSRVPEAQRLVDWLGADGRLLDAEAAGADFLTVIDTNLSESKPQPAITREITYLRRIDGWVDITVRWINDASTLDPSDYPRLQRSGVVFNPETRQYEEHIGVLGNYVRFYLPGGSEFTNVRGMDRGPRVAFDESGLMVLGGYVVIPQGESRTVSFSYRLTVEADAPLFVRKQGGQQRDEIRVLVNRPGGEQVTLYHGPLDHDLLLSP